MFVDCEATTWNLSPDLLADELEPGAVPAPRARAAVVVDLYGQCADYDRIVPLLDDHGVVLVEDAAEAIGAIGRRAPGRQLRALPRP